MYDSNTEINDIGNMLEWMGENLTKLPLEYQFKYLAVIMEFVNKVKPIYIASLMYLGEFNS